MVQNLGKRKEKQYKLISNDWIDFLNSLYKTQKLKQAVGLLPSGKEV